MKLLHENRITCSPLSKVDDPIVASFKRSHVCIICLALGRGYFSLVFGKNRVEALEVKHFQLTNG